VWEGGYTGPPGLVKDISLGHVVSVPTYPTVGGREFTVQATNMVGEAAVGFLVDSRAGHAFFIMGDETGPGGHPWTNAAPTSGYGPGWIHPNQVATWESCRCLGIEIQFEESTSGADIEEEVPRDPKPHTWGAIKALLRD
jgi:hypothetical protein